MAAWTGSEREAGIRLLLGPEPSIVRLEGDLDIATVPELELILTTIDADCTVVLDLQAVTLVGAAALTCFVHERDRRTGAGGSFVLRNPSPLARRVLEITKTGWLLDPAP